MRGGPFFAADTGSGGPPPWGETAVVGTRRAAHRRLRARLRRRRLHPRPAVAGDAARGRRPLPARARAGEARRHEQGRDDAGRARCAHRRDAGRGPAVVPGPRGAAVDAVRPPLPPGGRGGCGGRGRHRAAGARRSAGRGRGVRGAAVRRRRRAGARRRRAEGVRVGKPHRAAPHVLPRRRRRRLRRRRRRGRDDVPHAGADAHADGGARLGRALGRRSADGVGQHAGRLRDPRVAGRDVQAAARGGAGDRPLHGRRLRLASSSSASTRRSRRCSPAGSAVRSRPRSPARRRSWSPATGRATPSGSRPARRRTAPSLRSTRGSWARQAPTRPAPPRRTRSATSTPAPTCATRRPTC